MEPLSKKQKLNFGLATYASVAGGLTSLASRLCTPRGDVARDWGALLASCSDSDSETDTTDSGASTASDDESEPLDGSGCHANENTDWDEMRHVMREVHATLPSSVCQVNTEEPATSTESSPFTPSGGASMADIVNAIILQRRDHHRVAPWTPSPPQPPTGLVSGCGWGCSAGGCGCTIGSDRKEGVVDWQPVQSTCDGGGCGSGRDGILPRGTSSVEVPLWEHHGGREILPDTSYSACGQEGQDAGEAGGEAQGARQEGACNEGGVTIKRGKLAWYPPGSLQVYSRKGRLQEPSVKWTVPSSGFGFHKSDGTEVYNSMAAVLSSRGLNSQCRFKYCAGPHKNRSLAEARAIDKLF